MDDEDILDNLIEEEEEEEEEQSEKKDNVDNSPKQLEIKKS